MQISKLDARLDQLSATLSQLLDGEYDAIEDFGEVEGDVLGGIEEAVQFLVMDIKTVVMANRDKEAVLLMQQEDLVAKVELLEAQQRRNEEQERTLTTRAATIERQAAAIRELSTPVIEVWDDVLVLPIIGAIETHRRAELMGGLLESVVQKQAKWVILDVTGVEEIDTSTAAYLTTLVRASGLVGVSCLLSGVRPLVARTLVSLGVDLGEISTKRNLKSALEHCLREMHRS